MTQTIREEVSTFLGLLKWSNPLVAEDLELYEEFLSPKQYRETNLSIIYSASESEA
jgi:hypothetical protein